MAGQRQKHPDKLVYRRPSRLGVIPANIPDAARIGAVAAPEGLSEQSRRIFEQTIEVARSRLAPTDAFALHRWISWVDRWLREAALFEGEPATVPGSTGSEVVNPRLRALQIIEEHIVHAEQSMGLDPRARMRLGITHAAEQSALASLKKAPGRKPTIG